MDDSVELIYYLTPRKINILTNYTTNYKAINGYMDKGATVEVKDLIKESILTGKVININNLLDL